MMGGMDSRGNLIPVADDAEAKRLNLIPVPEAERKSVQAMTADERVAWFHAKLRERTRANRAEKRRTKRHRKADRKARRKLRASTKRK